MPAFAYLATVATSAPVVECRAAARQALEAKGVAVREEGGGVVADFGSQTKMRIVGGAFCPADWLTVQARIGVDDNGSGRRVLVAVSENVRFGSMIAMEKRIRRRCVSLAAELQAAIAQRVEPSEPLTEPTLAG